MLLFIGRDEFRIKCSTYEKENLDLSERVSKVVFFVVILSSNAMYFFLEKHSEKDFCDRKLFCQKVEEKV